MQVLAMPKNPEGPKSSPKNPEGPKKGSILSRTLTKKVNFSRV
jgi:hypothetical protein